MIAVCIRDGFRATLRRPWLVLLLWAWNLLLGVVAAFPAFNWWSTSFGFSPATDVLRDRFDFAVLGDLTKYDQMSGFSLLFGSMTGVFIVALVASAFVNGGILEVLGSHDDERSRLHRFFRGGGHFFGRFLRLLGLTVVASIVVGAIVGGIVGAATASFADSDWEPAGYIVGVVDFLLILIAVGWFILAQDYARIRVAADDSRGMFRAWIRAVGFVARQALGAYGIWIIVSVLSLLLVGGWFLYDGNAPSSTWGGIVAVILVQQVLLIGRTGARVMMVESERQYFQRSQPLLPEVITPAASALPIDPTLPVGAAIGTAPPETTSVASAASGPAEAAPDA